MAPIETPELQTETPNILEHCDDVTFRKHVFRLIESKLGAQALMRFIRLSHPEGGDFTEERRKWLDELKVSDVYNETTA